MDPLEDLLAVLYTTGKLPSTKDSDTDYLCPNCGADLTVDFLTGRKRCPKCP
jgi:predicted RNA-binding Zn-ribbon protein involved in translation (DUF1610 family)